MTEASGDVTARRAFFREGVARLVGPVGDFLEKRFRFVQPRTLLRPPGALLEEEFLDTCLRCGSCVEACPADAIFASDTGDAATAETPVVDPDRAPCVVCDGLDCMHACPSGALRLVEAPGLIRMGMAGVNQSVCVRSEGRDCTICVDQCPIGDSALRFNDAGPPEVLDPGCVGCGVCQHHCPTTPKAIVVEPR